MVDRITFCQRTWSTIHFPSMVSSICLNTLLWWLFSTPVYPMQSILFYLALNFPKCSPFVRHNSFNTGRSEVCWEYLKSWSRYIPLWNLLLLAHVSKSFSSLTSCLTFLFLIEHARYMSKHVEIVSSALLHFVQLLFLDLYVTQIKYYP